MPVATKICGLSTPETLDTAIAGGAAYVGFVFFPPSPRNVRDDRVRQLAARVPEHVGRVGVFVDPADSVVEQAVATEALDILQLHSTAPARASAIRARTGMPVWVAVAVRMRTDLDTAAGYRGIADRVLYDAKTPPGAALPGGMGVRFDWTLLQGHSHALPWALSGGLDPWNVAEAVRITGAGLVDVSSGVESAPGIKDAGRISDFLKVAKSL